MKSRLVNGFTLGLLGTASAIVLCAPSAFAQDAAPAAAAAPADNNEVIVTANRREQALQDVPVSVAAVSAQELELRNVQSLTQIVPGAIPGVSLAPFAGTPSVIAANIRGIGLSDSTQGTQELAVPIYIDGVFIGRGQATGLDLIEPQRVEFLRGPQGQLFGRNAEGGAIQYVAKAPSGVFGVDASVGFGSYDDQRERIRLDLPEFANFSVQLAAIHHEHDGYTRNGPKGFYAEQADYGLLDSDGYRAAVRWAPSDQLTVDYVFDDSQTTDSQPYGIWVADGQFGAPLVPPLLQDSGGSYRSVTPAPFFNQPFDSESLGHALTVAYELNDNVTLKSITAYREASRHGSSTLGGIIFTGLSFDPTFTNPFYVSSNAREDIDQNQTSEELQFLGSWTNFDLTVGAIYYNEQVNDQRRSYLTGPGINPTVAGTPLVGTSAAVIACIGFDPCLTSHAEQDAETKSYGVYAQGTYHVTSQLDLTLGVRYSNDEKDAVRTYIQPPTAIPPGGFTEATPSGALPVPANFSAERWDPAATIQYNWTDNLNTYVRYATAYRAGGANVRSSSFTSYKEEEIATWELGLKSQWFDRALTLNAALYHNDVKGQQQNVQEAPTINPALTNTINMPGTFTTDGLELESNWRVNNHITLGLTYAYLKADEFVTLADNPLTPTPGDPVRIYNINTPENTASASFTYTTNPTDFGEIVWHVDYSYASDYSTTPGAINPATIGPNFDRPNAQTSMLNARVALRDIPVAGGHGEIAIWGRNLLDDDNYVYGFDGAGFGNGFAEYLTVPLTAGIEFRYTR